jgi:hypothetical protein
METEVKQLLLVIEEKTIAQNQLLLKITDYNSRLMNLLPADKNHLSQLINDELKITTDINQAKHKALTLHYGDDFIDKFNRRGILVKKKFDRTHGENTELALLESELNKMNNNLFN